MPPRESALKAEDDPGRNTWKAQCGNTFLKAGAWKLVLGNLPQVAKGDPLLATAASPPSEPGNTSPLLINCQTRPIDNPAYPSPSNNALRSAFKNCTREKQTPLCKHHRHTDANARAHYTYPHAHTHTHTQTPQPQKCIRTPNLQAKPGRSSNCTGWATGRPRPTAPLPPDPHARQFQLKVQRVGRARGSVPSGCPRSAARLPGRSLWPPLRLGCHRLALPEARSPIGALAAFPAEAEAEPGARETPSRSRGARGRTSGVQEAAPAAYPRAAEARCGGGGGGGSASARSRGAGTARLAAVAAAERAPSLPVCSAREELGQRQEEEEEEEERTQLMMQKIVKLGVIIYLDEKLHGKMKQLARAA
ncbi:uncharacterized protein PHA67_008226 [Liasis olivaceus]